jgi:DNA modification methylase
VLCGSRTQCAETELDSCRVLPGDCGIVAGVDRMELTWTTGQVALGSLIEYDKNPVQISKRDAQELAKSLKKFGHIIPYTAAAPQNGDAVPILDGHQRKKVEMELLKVSPDTLVDVRFPSRALTDRERQEAIIRLRKNTGEFDPDALLNWYEADDLKDWGFDEKELTKIGFEFGGGGDAEPEIDRAEELLEKWGVKPGDLWQIGDHRLICGDCTDAATVARVMGGERAAFSVTSPPYPGAEMWETEGEKLVKVGNDCLLIMRDVIENGAAIAWNTSDIPCGQAGVQPNPSRDTMAALSMGWTKRAEIVWEKGLSYLPAPWNTRRPTVPNSTHELILIFYNGERLPREKEGKLNEDELLWNRESVWRISPAKASEENHIAPFPAELSQRCISLFTFENDLVYEPFSGSGTTLVACENLRRRCRAIEISPAYVAVALERMSAAFEGIEIRRLS